MNSIKLNLGCGAVRPQGWVNTDSSLNAHIQRIPIVGSIVHKMFHTVEYSDNNVVYMNLNKRWPYKNDSVDIVYASHLFEHLTLPSAELFLNESVLFGLWFQISTRFANDTFPNTNRVTRQIPLNLSCGPLICIGKDNTE